MPSTPRTDVVLPMTDDYMQQIVRGEKNYEFRKYRIAPTVKRVWFYLTAPFSCISYVCEIDPAVTRNEGDPKLVEDGLGNKEYNTFHVDWKGYDFAYRVRSVYKILEPITLAKMKSRYGCKGAPRGLIYLPEGIPKDVPWKSQKCIIPRADDKTPETTGQSGGKRAATVDSGDDETEDPGSKARPRKVSVGIVRCVHLSLDFDSPTCIEDSHHEFSIG
ncbi:hypothetical protein M413DRAFT_63141 [Hebeloma cylindrosporum]|uniref:ASCH domain-containing protein n=1 Tax=Hebeloma cylindrosporum TaxID=76867 RepID=A0A0C3CTH3_HEBCY|nr:hypothetical protein M413DRAFT_63141 [Hebeloma cylindrosporum h7]